MRVYGNLTNRIAEHTLNPQPTVGMGITIFYWSDRHAGTITRVSPSGKTFWFREDEAIRIDKNGQSESQAYRYEPQPDAREQVARLRKNGTWRSGGNGVALGYRRAYWDPSF